MFIQRLTAAFATCAALTAPAVAATFHNSEASWNSATSSSTPVVLPPTGSTNSFVAGGLTFSRTGGASNLIVGTLVDWSTLIAGDDLAVSGPEDVLIDFAAPVTAFAFLLHEPTTNSGLAPDSCNATCTDTDFVFRLFNGATEIAAFNFSPLDDVANFVGFTAKGGFNRLVIDDATGTIDNEFFGEFRTGAVIPLPAGMVLLLSGLGGLALLRRRGG